MLEYILDNPTLINLLAFMIYGFVTVCLAVIDIALVHSGERLWGKFTLVWAAITSVSVAMAWSVNGTFL